MIPGMPGQRPPMEMDQQRWPEILQAMQKQQMGPQAAQQPPPNPMGEGLNPMQAGQGQQAPGGGMMQQIMMQLFQQQMKQQNDNQAM